MHLGQQLHNLLGDRIQIGINLGQRARRLVLVEVAVEGIALYTTLPALVIYDSE